MTLTVLSPGMSHRIILLTVAVLMPALGSAQDLRESASHASLSAPLPNVWTLRDSARAYPLRTIQLASHGEGRRKPASRRGRGARRAIFAREPGGEPKQVMKRLETSFHWPTVHVELHELTATS